ncbi:hypothetical protein [Mumia sp. Pv 4-285]
MTDPTPFQMVGGDAPMCVDGVCELPAADVENSVRPEEPESDQSDRVTTS